VILNIQNPRPLAIRVFAKSVIGGLIVRFSDKCEAYGGVCSLLPKLCPRLVPSPLWRVNLARLVRLSAGEVEALEPGSTSTIVELRRYWWSINRRTCSVCGERGRHVDEEWEYYVVAGGEFTCSLIGDSGIAHLARIRVLCEKCHLAKHLGYASVTGRLSEALNHLARVNNVDEATAKITLQRAIDTWETLSRIENWTIVIGDIGLKEELKTRVEKLLNKLFEKTKQEQNPTPFKDTYRYRERGV
jgi:hypothetical protein